MTLPSPVLESAKLLVARRLGLEFPARRAADLERALTAVEPGREAALVAALHDDHAPEWRPLIHALTVRESYFFRDTAPLERALAELVARRGTEGELRLWSAGCAAGEEPYTLAMLLEQMLGDLAGRRLTILATDVDAPSLDAAARGRYGEWALRTTPAWARARYFDERFELSRQIRELVTFVPLNLVTDPYPGGFDLIVCRNVLMYFTEPARRAAVERLEAAVAPDGRLVLSPLDAPVGPGELVA